MPQKPHAKALLSIHKFIWRIQKSTSMQKTLFLDFGLTSVVRMQSQSKPYYLIIIDC